LALVPFLGIGAVLTISLNLNLLQLYYTLSMPAASKLMAGAVDLLPGGQTDRWGGYGYRASRHRNLQTIAGNTAESPEGGGLPGLFACHDLLPRWF